MSDKLILLEENIKELFDLKEKVSFEDIKKNKPDEWSIRYGLFESIQIVIDIACHIVSKYNLGNPKSYAECIEILESEKYIDSTLSGKLKGMIGFRNILIHDYIQIELKKLYGMLNNIDDFKNFISAIKQYIIDEDE